MRGEHPKMIFEQVLDNDANRIDYVYNIIKQSGQDMFENQGLIHWKTPYPKESIKQDCAQKKVFLLKQDGEYVHTFQLEFVKKDSGRDNASLQGLVSKFATLPKYSGQGIGKQSMGYIERICVENRVNTIKLDVYDKSKVAISFYKKRGFEVTNSKSTKHFEVYIMEKRL